MDQNTEMVTRMICTWTWKEIQAQPRALRHYMMTFISGQVLAVSLLHETAHNADAEKLNRSMWERIRAFDPELYRRIRRHPNAAIIVLPGPRMRRVVYHICQGVRKSLGF